MTCPFGVTTCRWLLSLEPLLSSADDGKFSSRPGRLAVQRDCITMVCCWTQNSLSTVSSVSLLQAEGCGEDCLNRHSYIHCDAKLCPAGAACSNRPFHQLRPPPMEVCPGGPRQPPGSRTLDAAVAWGRCCRILGQLSQRRATIGTVVARSALLTGWRCAALQRFLTEDRGWGVRATATIPRGSFIVEYAGACGLLTGITAC